MASHTITKLTETLETSMVGRTEYIVKELYEQVSLGVKQSAYRLHIDFNSTVGYENIDSYKKESLSNMLLTMLYTNRATMSNLNLILHNTSDPEDVIGYQGWLNENGSYIHADFYVGQGFIVSRYSSSVIDKFFEEGVALNSTSKMTAPDSMVRGISELDVVPSIVAEEATSDFITKANYLQAFKQITSGIATKIYDKQGEYRATFSAFFYASSVIKEFLVESNPTESGFIAIFQNDGVLIADSFENTKDGNVSKICDSDEPQVLELCDKIIANGGFDDENIVIPRYKTAYPKQKPVEHFVVSVTTLKRNGSIQLRLFVVVNNLEFTSGSRRSYIISSGIAAAVLIIAVAMIITVINPISQKLSQLSKGFQRIQNLDLNSKTIKSSWTDLTFAYELRVLQSNYEAMVSTLSSFSKYVAPVVVRNLVTSKIEAKLKLERQKNCVIFFMDIQDFTTLGEQLAPEDLVTLVSEAFEGTSNIIVNNNGIIDKYIGDCVMAFWRLDALLESQAQMYDSIENMACRSAIESIQYIQSMADSWSQRGFPVIKCRIGIHSGSVLMGNFGSQQRFDYTVIGDSVNTASRIEGLNKVYESTILVSDTVRSAVSENCEYLFRSMDFVQLKGKGVPVLVHELKDFLNNATEEIRSDYSLFELGMQAFIGAKFNEALAYFNTIQVKDLPTREKIHECQQLIQDKPDDWSYVKIMYGK
jgi:class 3 adenylate cyclase